MTTASTPRAAARVVEAVKVYGGGDAAVHALDGVGVDFPAGRRLAGCQDGRRLSRPQEVGRYGEVVVRPVSAGHAGHRPSDTGRPRARQGGGRLATRVRNLRRGPSREPAPPPAGRPPTAARPLSVAAGPSAP